MQSVATLTVSECALLGNLVVHTYGDHTEQLHKFEMKYIENISVEIQELIHMYKRSWRADESCGLVAVHSDVWGRCAAALRAVPDPWPTVASVPPPPAPSPHTGL